MVRWASAVAAGLVLQASVVYAAPVQAERTVFYIVKPGDTLFDLAARYLTRIEAYRTVAQDNKVVAARRLQPGQRLSIRETLLRTQPVTGVIAARTGDVWLEAGGRRERAEIGATVAEGARLATQAGSFATIEFTDETYINLPPNSTLRVETLRQIVLTGGLLRRFALETGRSVMKVTPDANPSSDFRMKTPISVAAVRGTEFRVALAAEDKAATEVTKGLVGVAASTGAEHSVPQDFGITASSDGLSGVQALLPPPKLIDGARRQQQTTVSFAVEPLQGAQAYRVQVARDAGFVDVITEQTQSEPRLDVGPLEDGFYFARAAALSVQGLEGRPSTYGFERELNTLTAAAPTLAGDRKTGPRMQFRWSTAGKGVRTFRFELARSPDMSSPLIDAPGLSQSAVTVSKPQAGTYYWRVTSTRRTARGVEQTLGEVQTLEIGN